MSYEDFKMDCDIIRALKSLEMHNWFVVMRRYHKTHEELMARRQWIEDQGPLYRKSIDDHNNELMAKQKERLEHWQRHLLDQLENGERPNLLCLVFSGIDKETVKKYGYDWN